MRYQSWMLAGLLLGVLVLPACTFKDTAHDKPAPNSIEDRQSSPPVGLQENPGSPQPNP